MNSLHIHPATKIALQAYSSQPPHALLLIGPVGIGKRTIAEAWAKLVVASSTYQAEIVEPDEKGSIGIATIRELYKSARSKRVQRQIIIVDKAETMSLEAENAFLKLLEEPRDGVTFILTATHTESLLPTILSRVQRVTLQPLPVAQMQAVVATRSPALTSADLAQVLFIADGRPGIALQLLDSPTLLEKERAIMLQAKELLTAKPYTRYMAMATLANDRETCLATIKAMLRMVVLQLKKPDQKKQLHDFVSLSNTLHSALQQIDRNGNLKAQLLRVFSNY